MSVPGRLCDESALEADLEPGTTGTPSPAILFNVGHYPAGLTASTASMLRSSHGGRTLRHSFGD